MACERWREMLSARLDGEDDPADRARVDEHLAGCPGCREWLERAATVNRLTRVGVTARVPDLSAEIVAALPAVGRPRTRERFASVLFVALALLGAVQIILGLAQVAGGASSDHIHIGLDATPGHLWHESAAWNVALGAGYLFIALRRHRPASMVPMLTAFVGMLLLLSVTDLSGDRVDGSRLVSHGFVILGYLLVVALSRVTAGPAAPPGARTGGGSGWRARFADDDERDAAPARPALRLIPGERGPLTAAGDRRAA